MAEVVPLGNRVANLLHLNPKQGSTAGSESIDFQGNTGSGSDVQMGPAILLKVHPTPIMTLAVCHA